MVIQGLTVASAKATLGQGIAAAQVLTLRGGAFVRAAKLHKAAILEQRKKQRTTAADGQGCPHCGAMDLQAKVADECWGICALHGTRWLNQGATEEADTATLYLIDLYQDITPAA